MAFLLKPKGYSSKMGNAERLSAEYTMLSVLEYLFLNSNVPVSKYHIMNKIKVIKQQRADRISVLLNRLVQNGYVTTIETHNSTFYKITEKGNNAYMKWIREFLNFVRKVKDY